MARQEIGGVVDDNNLNKVNHNFIELYDGVGDANRKIQDASRDLDNKLNNFIKNTSDEAFNKIVDSARLDWDEMVNTYDDLPTNAKEGTTIGVKSNSKVYRYDGIDWIEIYEINLNPISEVDERLSAQLAQTENNLNMQNWELNSKDREPKGITVFTSDDGHEDEYLVAKDIFQSENVPQTIYLVSTWLDKPGFLTKSQALELQSLGWEIGSHSRTHPRNPVMKDNPDDAFVEREFWESKRDLINMGFDVQNYAYPGGNYAKRERMFAKKYYRSARCSDRSRTRGINYTPLNTHELKTLWLDPVVTPFSTYLEQNDRATALQMMLDYCKEAIDWANDNEGMLVISTHFKEINTEDLKTLYRQVIQYAKTKTEVTTMREALNKMGNIVEVGDYSQYEYRAPGDTHYVIGADGLASGTASVAKKGRFTPLTHFEDFPYGVTYTPVRKADAEGAPFNESGLLINFKTENEEPGFNYQEYVLYGNHTLYRRTVKSDKTFNEWKVMSSRIILPQENNFSHMTTFSEFDTGITYSIVTGAHPDLSTAPEGKRGTLVTYRLTPGKTTPLYSYQEYHIQGSRAVYKRRVDENLNYFPWVRVNGELLASENNFTTKTPFKDFPIGTTFSIIQGNNPDLDDAPGNGTNGTLITTKVTSGAPYGYSFQEYHAFNSSTGLAWKRYAQGSDAWGPWVKTGG